MIELPPEVRAFEAWLRLWYPGLTERQITILLLRDYGLTQEEIAGQVGVSQFTICAELQEIGKLDL